VTRKTRLITPFVIAVVALAWAVGSPAQPNHKTENIVLIVIDGVRWQEIFTGADEALLNKEHGGSWQKDEALRKRYWRSTPEERREILMPFLWKMVATRGQIFGNREKGSDAHVTNGKAFSYPGYNEMLTGAPDDKIDSNDSGPNPNTTVFEWLNRQPEFRGKVAIFGTWDTFRDIFNQPRSGLAMQTGWRTPYSGKLAPEQAQLSELYGHTTRLDEEDVWDSFLQIPLLDAVKRDHPRVLFVGYGEADNWAHSGRYDLVLESLHEADYFISQLWQTMQAIPVYRDKTTFIVTADHGRGSGLTEWRDHGKEQKGSENIWIGVMGPDTPAMGERRNVDAVTQSQIAATVAALVGKDYPREVPTAALPIVEVLGGAKR
jgi:hypothetical protein